MCMSNARGAVEAIRQDAIRQGAQLGQQVEQPMTMPALPQLPPMPTLPAMPTQPAALPVTTTTAIAGPAAASSAPTAKVGGTAGRRRRGRDSGLGSLSIGSTQAAAGTGLNIGR